MKYNYLTSSLLNSWLYAISEYGDIDDFICTLKREPFERTDAMQAGIDFENECYAGQHEHIQRYIAGGLFQVECAKIYNNILIYGFADVLNYDTIYDIKRTGKYSLGKYFNTSQHKIYCYCLEVDKFKYLIQTNTGFFVEDYTYKTGQAEALITEFIEWLKATKLYEIWKERWVREWDGQAGVD